MRQAGKEAAEKAKSKPKSSAARSSATSGADLSKLDNSAPTGLPPPSGITDAASAKAPETGSAEVVSKADTVPSSSTQLSDESVRDTTATSKTSSTQAEALQGTTTDKVIDSSLDDLKPASSVDGVVDLSVGTPLAAPSGEIARHRGSSISTASKDAIKEAEEANKIDEEPEAEEQAVEDGEESAQVLQPGEMEKTDKQQDNGDKQPHIQFTGEVGGEEIDRVKATLSRDASPIHSPATGEARKTNDTTANEEIDDAQSDSAIPKPQEQAAAEPRHAVESVSD